MIEDIKNRKIDDMLRKLADLTSKIFDFRDMCSDLTT